METAYSYIYNFLTTNAQVATKIAPGNVFFIYAPMDTTGDLVVYNFSQDRSETKDVNAWEVVLRIETTAMLDAIQLVDILEAEFTADNSFKFVQNIETIYNPSREKSQIELIVTLKI